MRAGNNGGKCKITVLERMESFRHALKHLDDDSEIFVNEQISNRIRNGKQETLEFLTVCYRKDEKPMQEVVDEIIKELKLMKRDLKSPNVGLSRQIVNLKKD